MSDKEETKAAAPAKGGKKGRMMIIIVAAVVLLAGGGGGAWWFMNRGGEDAEAEAKVEPEQPPVFVALEPFTVNLQPEAVGTQYMQVGITVKVSSQPVADKLKELMPEVRNRLLMVLSAKKASELLVPAGKDLLAQELHAEITGLLDPAAAKKAAAPAAKAKPAITVAAAAAETGTDATEPKPEAAAEGAEAEAEPAAPAPAAATAAKDGAKGAAARPPVLSVLFTSLIIQ